jgi:arylmalonate decarboxylase
MTISRRDAVKAGAAALTLSAVGAQAAEPLIGLISPTPNHPIPEDAQRLYPGVRFLSDGTGLPGGMTAAGFDEAVPRIVPTALRLAKKGVNAISIAGSSMTFYRGAKFNEELVQRVSKATGLPATSQSNGLLDGLRVVNARRVAVATPYIEDVTQRLKTFLEENGFEVTNTKCLGYETLSEDTLSQDDLFKLGSDTCAASAKADALVLSCGALKTLDLIGRLEGHVNIPVVSSTPHGLMNAVRLVGVAPRVQGFGIVFAKA